MAKTKPIGVRFNDDLLKALAEDNLADSPQKALNFLTEFYFKHQDKFDFIQVMKDSKLFALNNPKTVDIQLDKKKVLKGTVEYIPKSITEKDMVAYAEQRIKDIEAELKNPPKSPIIGLKKWTAIRYEELEELKNKII